MAVEVHMPLHDVQTALGLFIAQRASGSHGITNILTLLKGLQLSAEERAWLEQLPGSPGFEVTCHVQRWWRETRLQWTVPLTMAALGADRRTKMLQAYFNAVPCSSLFFGPEAVAFLDFVLHTAPELPHLTAIAGFERARLLAAEAAPWPSCGTAELARLVPTDQMQRHPAAAVVAFATSPESLLGALLLGRPLPAPEPQEWPILVAPGLPYLWRPATVEEALVFARCHPAATMAGLLAAVHGDKQPLYALLEAGAIYMVTGAKLSVRRLMP
jgi:hypothetical protein